MNFADRMKKVIRKNLVTNNVLSEKIPEKKNKSDNIIKMDYEIHELEKNIENKVLQLGNEVYNLLIKKGEHFLGKNTEEIRDLLLEIEKLEELIMEKELHQKMSSPRKQRKRE